MAEQRHISVPKTARYFVEGNLSPSTKVVLIALHGYSQSAEFFIRKFRGIVNADLVVVAPEGLHRFYLAGHAGRVGASWMTKVDREADIEDYCSYLNVLTAQLKESAPNAVLHVLGFSQGGATAVRWSTTTQHPIARLILWAGSFPPDVDLGKAKERLNELNLRLVIGDADEFIAQHDIQNVEDLLNTAGISFEIERFLGGHDIDADVLGGLF